MHGIRIADTLMESALKVTHAYKIQKLSYCKFGYFCTNLL